MNPSLTAGVFETHSFVLDTSRTIDFMGEELRVYATPSMINDMEHLCRDLLKRHLGPQEDSVGARVEIDHLAPTVIGQNVTLRATVHEIQLPRVVFSVAISDDVEVVGLGTHVRFVVDTMRQHGRLLKKFRRWEEQRNANAAGG
jgi:fluoroacetyl-CoA thioesterase